MKKCVSDIIANDKLPSPPTVAIRLLDLVTNPDVTISELTKVLGADPRLSSRLISYCNSPLVGTKRTISSLPQAVTVLGMRTLRLLSLSFSLLDSKDNSDFDFDGFWRSSLATAVSAKCVAKRGGQNGDEAFLSGLLLNIGVLGMGTAFPQEMGKLLRDDSRVLEWTIEREQAEFGTNRYEVGGALLSKWHFPKPMVDSIEGLNPSCPQDEGKTLLLGQQLGELLLSSQAVNREIVRVKDLANEFAGVGEQGFSELFDEVAADWVEYSEIFSYPSIAFSSMEDLEARARESMIEISMGLESDLEELTLKNRELEENSLIDGLTLLKNRAAYEAEVVGALDHHKRRRQSFGMIVIDIDRFKLFNDVYGHAAGDAVLRAVGKCLASSCRNYDTVYRYGGEEFVAVIQDCSRDAIKTVAHRFHNAIQEISVQFENQTLAVTASVGVCWSEEAQETSPLELFQKADASLYKAKAAGRNCVVFDDDDAAVCAI